MEYKNKTEICGTLKWAPRIGDKGKGPFCYFGATTTVDGKTFTMACAAFGDVADAMRELSEGDWVDCEGQLGATKNKDQQWETKLYVKKLGTFAPVNKPVEDDTSEPF